MGRTAQGSGHPGRWSERATRDIVDATASVVGEQFMGRFVRACASALDAEYAYVSESTSDAATVHIIAVWNHGELYRDIHYDVSGTPAAVLQRTGEMVTHSRGVASRFHDAPMLAKRGIEWFAAVPLRAGGTVIGQAGVLGRELRRDIDTVEVVLHAVAPRVEAELERERLIHQLREQDQLSRLASEDDVRPAAQREHDMVTALADLVFRIGSDGVCKEYFDAKRMRTPIAPSEFLGRNLAEVWPEQVANPVLRRIRSAAETGVTQRFGYPIRIDGEERYREARIVPTSEREVLVFVRDATSDPRMTWGGEHYAAPEDFETRMHAQPERANRYGLTSREAEVLELMSGGLADKEIATGLGVRQGTVNKHVSAILRKMQATSRTAAAVRAVREGLVGPSLAADAD